MEHPLCLCVEAFAKLNRLPVPSPGTRLAKAEQSRPAELRGLAESLWQDQASIAAPLTESWSNGPHVNRLKIIKRQMHRRAGNPLLRARVLWAA
jgi:transposase